MPIKTTCIGAFPKPDYVPISDWFHVDLAEENYASDVVDRWSEDPKYEDAFVRATHEVVAAQVAAGIDIPTDGEQRRENYVHYQCRHFDGFDFERLERRVMRNGAYDTELPAIRGPVRRRPESVLPRDFRIAQQATDKPIKITIPGPLTIWDTTADMYYNDPQRLARDLAEALNGEVRALADAGCKHIQIDEPVFARRPKEALEFGVEMLERCFHGIEGVERTVHMCCGYPDRLDNPDYPKADHAVYHQLVEALDGKIDALSIEDCHWKNDLELFAKFHKTKAIVGLVDVAVSRVEPVEEIVKRIREIKSILPEDRIIGAPDCGLGFLGRELTEIKLKNMCDAARQA
jgi:5-methyltetrahydropteroyltriglutamate--homocysteine methyltransferase